MWFVTVPYLFFWDELFCEWDNLNNVEGETNPTMILFGKFQCRIVWKISIAKPHFIEKSKLWAQEQIKFFYGNCTLNYLLGKGEEKQNSSKQIPLNLQLYCILYNI